MARRRRLFPKIISWFLLLLIFLGVTGVVIGVKMHQDKEELGIVARVEIDLNDTTLDEMKDGDKEAKYPDNQLKSYQGAGKMYQGVEIKGRGNLTWAAGKKPWQIKFDKKTDFLGITKAKKWVFLANYYDDSHIRSDLAAKLAEMIGGEYNYRGEFAEVYFDGEYEGLFYVLPRIEVGKGVVDLKDELGVVVELDNFRRDETDIRYTSYMGSSLLLKDAVSKNDEIRKQEAMEQFMTDYNKLEKYVERGDYAGAAEVADMESFAEYYLASEFAANPDAYTTSFYFYKDGADDKIHAGPMWDFDLAFSNNAWGELSPTETMERRAEVFGENGEEGPDQATSKLVYYLMEMPEFQDIVKQKYQDKLAGRKSELIKEARRTVERIREYAVRDGEKWDKQNFDREVEKVLEWVETRYDYMDQVYGNKNQEVEKSVI